MSTLTCFSFPWLGTIKHLRDRSGREGRGRWSFRCCGPRRCPPGTRRSNCCQELR